MILFSDANGTIQTNFGTPVYQGSANSNIIYLIAPYAPAASVLVGFQLPDGSAVAPVAMTALNAVPGVQNAGGTSYAGWSYVLPAAVTAKYGTVTAQFFFYAPTGESTNPTAIIATSATSFQVGRGAAAVLPDTPDADVYESILSNLAQLQTDLNGGYYGARAIFPWSNGATYGLNEITFYPSIGTYGAFVQSVVAGNTNNTPYVDGAINSAYWKEVVNFNTVTEDYFQQVQEAIRQAASAAIQAENSAQAAANSATLSTNSATVAIERAAAASGFANNAEAYAQQSAQSAQAAAASATQSQNSANQSGTYASNAQTSAQNAANSATEAQQYAQQAQQYAQKHYQVVASVSELPRPGDSAFIYLVPTGSGTSNDSYSEYLWITESNDYEFIGTTADIDLSNYAQINGTYAGMTVGNATNAQTATNAQQLGGVAAANYAQTNGTYSGMTVGKATQAQNAATATDSEKLGGVLANQYAIITGTYSGMTVGNATNATNADTADSATSAQDSAKLGGVAASEYAQIAQIPSNVISVESLPTATADSPDFVQTPDGTLYRKKYTQTIDGDVIGIYRFNDNADRANGVYNLDFTSNGKTFTSIEIDSETAFIRYHNSDGSYANAFMGSWVEEYRIITVTNVLPSNVSVIQNLLTNYAVKQPSTTYSYAEIGAGTIEYMTDEEVDALFLSIPSFAEATWEQIAQASEAGTAKDYFAVGDEKTISLSTDEQITLVILGFDHDDLSDGSGKAGITIGMKNLLATQYRMNATFTNSGGWDESEMRTSTMATLLSQLPADLRNVIKQVNKKATAGSQSTTITTSADKLFLFALAELASKTGLENSMGASIKDNAATYEQEGTQYEYFKNTVGDADIYNDCPALVKKLSNGGGSARFWWLRSPILDYSTYFWYVLPAGSVGINSADNSYGVSFGFCV